MNAKHTPGPWTHGTHNHRKAVYAVCRYPIPIAYVGGNGQPHETETANARLIAAAPAMLEALRKTLGLAEAYYRTLPDDGAAQDHYMAEVIAPARAAIARAEGE